MTQPDDLIQQLQQHFQLKPLPGEGGYYVETYRSPDIVPAAALPARYSSGKPVGTAILFLLTPGPDGFSALHRLLSDEIYHFYLGDPVDLLLLHADGSSEVIQLGQDIFNGQQVQVTVPRGTWQGARLAGGGRFALLGTTMAPGFDPQDYQPGQRADLLRQYPAEAERITRLTREP